MWQTRNLIIGVGRVEKAVMRPQPSSLASLLYLNGLIGRLMQHAQNWHPCGAATDGHSRLDDSCGDISDIGIFQRLKWFEWGILSCLPDLNLSTEK